MLLGGCPSKGHEYGFWLFPLSKLEEEKDGDAVLDVERCARVKGDRTGLGCLRLDCGAREKETVYRDISVTAP